MGLCSSRWSPCSQGHRWDAQLMMNSKSFKTLWWGKKAKKKPKPYGKNLKLIIYLDSRVFKCIQKFREPGYGFQQAGNREQNLHLCAQHSLWRDAERGTKVHVMVAACRLAAVMTNACIQGGNFFHRLQFKIFIDLAFSSKPKIWPGDLCDVYQHTQM